MAQFCLPPKIAQAFQDKIKSGTIDPSKLVEMSSKERREFFEEHLGEEHAEPTNRLFETRMLLKNQQTAYIQWAKKLLGLTPEVRRDLIAKIERLDRVLDAPEEKAFLEDLASYKLGGRVTYEEAQMINDLANNIAANEHNKGHADYDTRMEYGRAVVDLEDYVNDLKTASPGLRETLKSPRAIGSAVLRGIKNIPNTAKAVQASMDNSAVFRQGWRTIFTNPQIWATNALRSFKHLFDVRQNSKAIMREINAEIKSRPNYDLMRRANLDVGTTEEAFPTSLPEKVPILGRAYKRSELAYTAFTHQLRADVFDKMVKVAEKNKVDLTTEELQSIGKMVNALTGRGHLGALEPAGKAINSILFSPKMMKAQIDQVMHPVTGAGGSNFVRKQAALNLLKSTAGMAVILATAKWLAPNSVELDPRSSDFGKIKVGNTRFDVTGGASSFLVLMARIAASAAKYGGANVKSFKSSTSGELRDLTNPEFGKQNLLDVTEDFFENKAAPFFGMLRDFAKGQTFDHKKPTPTGEALQLLTPMPVKTLVELLKDPVAKKDPRFIAFAQVADMLGISVNTYKPEKGKPKEDITLKDLVQMAESVPDKLK